VGHSQVAREDAGAAGPHVTEARQGRDAVVNGRFGNTESGEEPSMRDSRWIRLAAFVVVFGAGVVAGRSSDGVAAVSAQVPGRVFELRTYTAPDGKLGDLHRRFRDHTLRIFAKHGMTNVAYFSPMDGPLAQNTMIYLLAHPSREAAKASWGAFIADPEWNRVASESQVNGPITSKIESVFLTPTDYSPLK
jgi:hypothetical protein